MDDITREKVRRVLIRLGIALGYAGDKRQIDLRRARAVLDEFELDYYGQVQPVSYLSIESMTVDILEKAGVDTIDKLASMDDVEILGLPRMGTYRLHEIRSALAVYEASR